MMLLLMTKFTVFSGTIILCETMYLELDKAARKPSIHCFKKKKISKFGQQIKSLIVCVFFFKSFFFFLQETNEGENQIIYGTGKSS